MSIPVSFLNVPESIMESAYFATDKSKSRKHGDGALMPLSFPQSNVALWDATPQGKPVCLHVAQFRNVRLLILEKTLRLAHRHANQFGGKPQSAFLIGSLNVDNDEEGITVTVDRFDPGRGTPGGHGAPGAVVPTALLPGDFLIPLCVGPVRTGSEKTATHSRDDFLAAFKSLQQLASSREASDPGRLLLARAVLEGAPSGPGALSLSLSLAAVVVARCVSAAPVRPLPIIPTALARNLAGPASIARVQAACKSGYLTMDQTRKLLLILESDPKAQSLPLVGIWVSGVMHVANPHVWACCLRFFFGSFIRQRLLAEGSRCLLLLYTLTHSEPEFYECSLTSGQGLDFNLYSCSETLHVFKDVEAAERPPVQLELAPDRKSAEWGLFNGALSSAPGLRMGEGPASPGQRCLPSDNDSGLEEEDFSPRPTPSPHPNTQLSPKVRPCVPELSLLCDGTFLPGARPPSPCNDENRAPAERARPAKRASDRRPATPLAHDRDAPPSSRADAGSARLPPPIRQPLMPKNQPQQQDSGGARTPVILTPVMTAAGRPLSQASPGPVLCPLAMGGGGGGSGRAPPCARSPDASFQRRCPGERPEGTARQEATQQRQQQAANLSSSPSTQDRQLQQQQQHHQQRHQQEQHHHHNRQQQQHHQQIHHQLQQNPTQQHQQQQNWQQQENPQQRQLNPQREPQPHNTQQQQQHWEWQQNPQHQQQHPQHQQQKSRQQQHQNQHQQNPQQQQQAQHQPAPSHHRGHRQPRSPSRFQAEAPHGANFATPWPCQRAQRATERCCCLRPDARDCGGSDAAGRALPRATGGGSVGATAEGAGFPAHGGWPELLPPVAGAACGPKQGPPGCPHAASALSADAYCLLMEQDRQLKLLQAQIQKLLAAQNCVPGSQRDEVFVATSSSPGSRDPAASENERATGTQKQAVSIACETGGSLIWGAGGGETAGETRGGHAPSGDDARDAPGGAGGDGGTGSPLHGEATARDDSELALSVDDEGAVAEAVAAGIAACDASVASSLRAVDLPSFVESRGSADDSSRSSEDSPPMGTTHHAGRASPALGESVSICVHADRQGGGGGSGAAPGTPEVASAGEQADGESNSLLMRDEKQFYHNLLHKVNRLLTNSAETPAEDSIPSDREESSPGVPPCPGAAAPAKTPRVDTAAHGVTSRRKKSEDNSVETATLKQLRKMGVRLEGEGMECGVSGGGSKHSEQAERASTLARILPRAAALALPHFSYSSLSFATGTSGFFGDPGTSVDLSMEANAIALKYLSDVQLAQLSRSGGGGGGGGFGSGRAAEAARVSLAASGSDSDRSTAPGLLSPSNMSFATRRYMQKYGLIEGGSSSSDDDDDGEDDDDADDNLERDSEQQVDASRRKDSPGGRVPTEKPDAVPDAIAKSPATTTAGDFSRTHDPDLTPGARLGERPSAARRNSEPSLVTAVEAATAASSGSRRSTGEGRAFADAAGPRDESTVQVLKGLTQPQRKLLSTGHAVFTRHPLRVLPERKRVLGDGGGAGGAGGAGSVTSTSRGTVPEKLRGSDREESMGNILDIERLRQLPKLF